MTIELLSPARNLKVGKAAISAGADAVYIGGPSFGARASAGNSIQDIRELVVYAHQFSVKVFVTLNTLLYDNELAEAESLCNDLYAAGVDALIIQDTALLKLKLPPIPLHASTQMHNNTPERVKFLEGAGIKRVVLARELSIEQIRNVRAGTGVELEAFIHGSLCVSFSGRCFMSESIGNRSANRGECAQPCRNKYSLTDESGNVIIKDKHLLSLRDLNRSAFISDMIDAGISSFKIEGRLKDADYVKNITAYYNGLLNEAVASKPGLNRSSSGSVDLKFPPNPDKSFNRGFTDYFAVSRNSNLTNPASPKSIGSEIGEVVEIKGKATRLKLLKGVELANGDGLCWISKSGSMQGTGVNTASCEFEFPTGEYNQWMVELADNSDLQPGIKIRRNFDKAFTELVENDGSAIRSISIDLSLKESPEGFILSGVDEDGIISEMSMVCEKIPATNPDAGYQKVKEQLRKSGGTIFRVMNIEVLLDKDLFFKHSVLNQLRRSLLDVALKNRLNVYAEKQKADESSNRNYQDRIKSHKDRLHKNSDHYSNYPYSPDELTGKENITNKQAAEFYSENGVDVTSIQMQSFKDSGMSDPNLPLMTTKFCLRYELGKSPVHQSTDPVFPKTLYLSNRDGRFRLNFDCKACVMKIYKAK